MAEDTKKTLQTQFLNIANLLCVLDRKIDSTISTLVTLSSLFRTRMHQLMTAQIRVKALSLPKTCYNP